MTDYLLSECLLLQDSKQIIDEVDVFPPEYFAPLKFQTEKLTIYDSTISIDICKRSWLNQKDVFNLTVLETFYFFLRKQMFLKL